MRKLLLAIIFICIPSMANACSGGGQSEYSDLGPWNNSDRKFFYIIGEVVSIEVERVARIKVIKNYNLSRYSEEYKRTSPERNEIIDAYYPEPGFCTGYVDMKVGLVGVFGFPTKDDLAIEKSEGLLLLATKTVPGF